MLAFTSSHTSLYFLRGQGPLRTPAPGHLPRLPPPTLGGPEWSFCVCFFWRDCSATAGWMFTKSSPKDVFAVLFVNGGTPMKIAPSKKNYVAQTSIFERKFRLRRLRTAAACKRWGILGKLKQQVGLSTISRLHTFTSTFGEIRSGGILVMGTHKLCIVWPMAHGAVLKVYSSQKMN